MERTHLDLFKDPANPLRSELKTLGLVVRCQLSFFVDLSPPLSSYDVCLFFLG